MEHRTKIIWIIILTLMTIPAMALAGSQIDAMPEDGFIVIGDRTFKFADEVVFLDENESTRLSLSDFEEGDWVEIDLTPEGEIDEMRMSSESQE